VSAASRQTSQNGLLALVAASARFLTVGKLGNLDLRPTAPGNTNDQCGYMAVSQYYYNTKVQKHKICGNRSAPTTNTPMQRRKRYEPVSEAKVRGLSDHEGQPYPGKSRVTTSPQCEQGYSSIFPFIIEYDTVLGSTLRYVPYLFQGSNHLDSRVHSANRATRREQKTRCPSWLWLLVRAILTSIPVRGTRLGFKFHSCHPLLVLVFIPVRPCSIAGRHRVQLKLQGKAGVVILTTDKDSFLGRDLFE